MSSPAGAADPVQIGRDDPTRSEIEPTRHDPAASDAVAAAQAPPPERIQPAAELPANVVSLARAAAVEEAGGDSAVGNYLGAVVEDEVTVSAAFASQDRGYRGWYWSVTVALVEPSAPTVSEVLLLPGQDALLAPPWVPWDRRIRPGDLGPNDLLPPPADDIRMVPGYVFSDDPAVREVAYEFGLGRERVLSREGRDDAAERWHEGTFGPDDPIALAAPANCVTCAFYVPLAGLLGSTFGACANGYSPADGRVVDAGYGCGAHSQTVIEAPLISASSDTVVDELVLEVHPRRPAVTAAPDPESAVEADPDPEPTADPQQSAAGLDPEPDAEPDLLAEVVTDPVIDAVVEAAVVEAAVVDAEPVVEFDVAWDLEPAHTAAESPADLSETTP